jgi:hypothetical protein
LYDRNNSNFNDLPTGREGFNIMQTLKNITENQWYWIATQAFFTFVFFLKGGWVLALVANAITIFIVLAALEVWHEGK